MKKWTPFGKSSDKDEEPSPSPGPPPPPADPRARSSIMSPDVFATPNKQYSVHSSGSTSQLPTSNYTSTQGSNFAPITPGEGSYSNAPAPYTDPRGPGYGSEEGGDGNRSGEANQTLLSNTTFDSEQFVSMMLEVGDEDLADDPEFADRLRQWKSIIPTQAPGEQRERYQGESTSQHYDACND